MKKYHLRQLLLIVLVLCLGIQLCACGNSESEAMTCNCDCGCEQGAFESESQPTIIGYWQGYFRFDDYTFYHSWESGEELYIYEDGTFQIDGENGDDDGTYELLFDGESIEFNFGDCAYGPYDIWLESGDTLVIDTDEYTYYLNRVS